MPFEDCFTAFKGVCHGIGERLFGDKKVARIIETDNFGGMCASLVQHRELLDSLEKHAVEGKKIGIALVIILQHHFFTHTTSSVQRKKLVNHPSFHVVEGASFGPAFEREEKF